MKALLGALLVLGLLGGGVDVAVADEAQNNAATVDGTKLVTVTAGGDAAEVKYRVFKEDDTGEANSDTCNVSSAPNDSLAITPNVPAGVSKSPASRSFTTCNDYQSISFSASAAVAPGDYLIASTLSGATTNMDNLASFTLRVVAPGKSAGSVTINNLPSGATYGGSFTPTYTKAGDGATSVSSLTSATCTVTGGAVSFGAAGTCTLLASVAEGTSHLAATGAQQSFTIAKAAGSVSINNLPIAAAYGGSFTPTFSVLGTGSASVASLTTGVCTVVGGDVRFEALGTCTLQASATAGDDHLAATGVGQSFTIGKAAGAVTISNLPSAAVFGGSFSPTYTKAGDGAASTTSLSPTICSVSSGVVSFEATGTCTLEASVAAGTYHLAATGAGQVFSIAKAPGSVSISNIPSSPVFGGSFTPTYDTAGDGTASAASLTTSTCTVGSTGLVRFVGAGTCKLQASVAEGSNHLAATGNEQVLEIAKAPATVSISNVPTTAVFGGGFTPSVTTNSAGTTSVSSLTPGTCTVDGVGVVSYVGAGTCTLTTSVAESANHLAGEGAPQGFAIAKAPGSVSIDNIPTTAVFGGTFTPAFTKAGDGAVSVTSSTPTTCTVDGAGVVSYAGAGACTLQASVAEGTNHLGALGAGQSFDIAKAAGSVVIDNIPSNATFGGNFTPVFTRAGDGIASVVSLTAGTCEVAEGVVRFVAAGGCTLQASVAEGTNHLAADGAAQPFTVAKAPGSVTIDNMPEGPVTIGGSFTPTITKAGDGAASFVSLTPSACTVSSAGVVTYVGVGDCTLRASVGAGTNHLAATGTSQTVDVDFEWTGFFQPIDNPTTTSYGWNKAKAGSVIPVKFSLSGDRGMNIFEVGHPKVTPVNCTSTAATGDAIEEFASNASGLKYDSVADQYNYAWKTSGTYAGKCVRLDVKLIDGTIHSAYFNLTK